MIQKRVEVYDTTLRDGTQGEGINFSVADKCRIAQELDDLGVDFIEGGWPGSNPRDVAFFSEVHNLNLTTSRIAAFGATRRAGLTCDNDKNLQSLLLAQTPVVTIFGKSWEQHVNEAHRISLAEKLEVIEDSVQNL
jgi:2-isopropylmalate synthase